MKNLFLLLPILLVACKAKGDDDSPPPESPDVIEGNIYTGTWTVGSATGPIGITFFDEDSVTVSLPGSACFPVSTGRYLYQEGKVTADLSSGFDASTAEGFVIEDVITGSFEYTEGDCAGVMGTFEATLSGIVVADPIVEEEQPIGDLVQYNYVELGNGDVFITEVRRQ